MIQSTFSALTKNDFPRYPASTERCDMLRHLYPHMQVTLLAARHYVCSPKWQLEPRMLQNSYWTYLIKGSGTVIIGNHSYAVNGGDLILFPEGVKHSLTHPGKKKLEMVNVHFHAKIYGLMDFLGLTGLEGVISGGTALSSSVSSELARLHALEPPCGRESASELIRAILVHAFYHLKKKTEVKSAEFKKLAKLFPALELITRRIGDPGLRQSDLAKELRISEVYMRKIFNDLFRESPVKFINHRRIEHACSLLRQSDSPVKTVAEKSGFRDLQFFYRVFGRITGTTPARYRNSPDSF